MVVYVVFADGLGYHHLTPEWTDDAAWCVPLRNQLPSITAPNWASILSGVAPWVHGVLDNNEVRHFGDRDTFLHHARGSVHVVSDWRPFRHLTPGLPFTHDRTPLRHMARYRADVVLINLDRLDSRAHKHGWNSPEAAVTRLNLARELAAFRHAHPDDTVLVIADHGGFRKNHESATHPAVRTVPLLCYGAGIERPRFRTTLGFARWFNRTFH